MEVGDRIISDYVPGTIDFDSIVGIQQVCSIRNVTLSVSGPTVHTITIVTADHDVVLNKKVL